MNEILSITKSMKWRIAFICFFYLVGFAFCAAWYVEAERRTLNPPNRVFTLNDINWMVKTGAVFLFFGSSVLTAVLVEGVYAVFVRFRLWLLTARSANKY